MTYRYQLDKLKLTTLLERRVRGGLIEMFKRIFSPSNFVIIQKPNKIKD